MMLSSPIPLLFMCLPLFVIVRVVMALIIYADTDGYYTQRWPWAVAGLLGGLLALLIWLTVNKEIPHTGKIPSKPIPQYQQTLPQYPYPSPYYPPSPYHYQYPTGHPTSGRPVQGYPPEGGWGQAGYRYPPRYYYQPKHPPARREMKRQSEQSSGGARSHKEEKI